MVVTEIGVETWVEEDEDRTCGIRSAFSYLGSSLRLVDGCVSGSSKESNSVSILHPLSELRSISHQSNRILDHSTIH